MQNVIDGYRGLGLLVEINSDRVLSVLIIVAAMAAVGMVGVEYFNSVIVERSMQTIPTMV